MTPLQPPPLLPTEGLALATSALLGQAVETEIEKMRFRKKPVVIDAQQWVGSNAVDLLAWIGECGNQDGSTLIIHTLEGDHEASLGDWIIKGVKGEFYPCKPDVFALTYEPAP